MTNGELGIEGCDAGAFASVYMDRDGKWICRCLICARCEHHTGNSNYGHYTRACKNAVNAPSMTTKQYLDAIKDIPHHFCCPDDCELDE